MPDPRQTPCPISEPGQQQRNTDSYRHLPFFKRRRLPSRVLKCLLRRSHSILRKQRHRPLLLPQSSASATPITFTERETYTTTQPLRSQPPTLFPFPLRHNSSDLGRQLLVPLITTTNIDDPAVPIQQALPSAPNTYAHPEEPLANTSTTRVTILHRVKVRDALRSLSAESLKHAVIGCEDLPLPAWAKWRRRTVEENPTSKKQAGRALLEIMEYFEGGGSDEPPFHACRILYLVLAIRDGDIKGMDV